MNRISNRKNLGTARSGEERAYAEKVLSLLGLFLAISSFGLPMNAPQPGHRSRIESTDRGIFSTLLGRFAVSGDTGNPCLAQELGSPYPFKPISPQTHLTENPAERATSQKRLSIQGKYAAYSQAKALQEDSTLRAVAFGSKTTGIACGDRGTILRSVDGGHSWKLVDHDHQYSFTDIAWLSPQRAIMVGGLLDRVTGLSRGMVLWTQDAGLSWQEAMDTELPMLWSVTWDGSQLTASGCWSDSLLTDAFESYDQGLTWHAATPDTHKTARAGFSRTDQLRWRVATDQLITVRDACRTSESGRCLVGDHGVITVTNDNGRTWQRVRGESRKTAVLFICRSALDVPWSLVGHEALESRHRVSILCQNQQNNVSSERTLSHQRHDRQLARQAALTCGAAGLDYLDIVDDASSNDGKELGDIAKQWVAVFEPEVVVLDSSLESHIKDAFLNAGISRKAKRVMEYAFCDPEQGAGQGRLLHRNALLSQTGILASDLQSDAFHWIAPHQSPGRSIRTISLFDVATAAARGESLMNGLSIKEGEQLSSTPPPSSRRKLQIARARIKRDQQLEQLIEKTPSLDQFSRLLEHLIESTDKDDQFRLTWETVLRTSDRVNDYASLKRYEIALNTCIDRFPDLSASHWAQLRLHSIQKSVEWRKLRALLSETSQKSKPQHDTQSVVVSPFQQQNHGGVQMASAVSPVHSTVSPVVVPSLKNDSSEPEEKSPQTTLDLRWEFHPLVLLSREAARLRNDTEELQVADQASPNLVRLKDSNVSWGQLLKTNGKTSLFANNTLSPPHLDGQLNDSCWQSATLIHEGIAVRVSHDEEYLYLGISVPTHSIHVNHEQLSPNTHQRDQSLDPFHRLAIFIDTDRDLLSSMQLQVTSDGRVHDAIDGCKNWQPTWYPAVQISADTTTYEIAILRRDITELPITSADKWFLSIRSVEPEMAIQNEMMPRPNQWTQVTFE